MRPQHRQLRSPRGASNNATLISASARRRPRRRPPGRRQRQPAPTADSLTAEAAIDDCRARTRATRPPCGFTSVKNAFIKGNGKHRGPASSAGSTTAAACQPQPDHRQLREQATSSTAATGRTTDDNNYLDDARAWSAARTCKLHRVRRTRRSSTTGVGAGERARRGQLLHLSRPSAVYQVTGNSTLPGRGDTGTNGGTGTTAGTGSTASAPASTGGSIGGNTAGTSTSTTSAGRLGGNTGQHRDGTAGTTGNTGGHQRWAPPGVPPKLCYFLTGQEHLAAGPRRSTAPGFLSSPAGTTVAFTNGVHRSTLHHREPRSRSTSSSSPVSTWSTCWSSRTPTSSCAAKGHTYQQTCSSPR